MNGRLRFRQWLIILAISAGIGACLAPMRLSAACQSRVSDCLASCEEEPRHDEPAGHSSDIRSACERRCHNVCSPEKLPPPAELPKEGFKP